MKKHGLSKLLAVVVAGMVLNAYAAERVVVEGAFDSIHKILKDLGWDYELIDGSQLLNYDLSEVKQLYINCGSDSFAANLAKVKEWVEAGGYLYASDWSSEYMEGWGLEFKGDGYRSDIVATVEDLGLKSYIGSDLVEGKLPIEYDLPGWHRIVNTAGATVLLHGNMEIFSMVDFSAIEIETPLAVTLKAGKGRAIYTTFHNETGGITQPGMKKAVEYFAMVPQAQAAGDKLVANKGLDSNKVVGFAIGTLEQAASNGVGIQGIPAGFDGKYLFQVTNILTESATETTLASAGSYTLQLFNSKGTEYKSLSVTSNDAVDIDVPAADNDGSGWTFKISNASGYKSSQSVIAVSWKGDYKGSAGGGGGDGVGSNSSSKSPSSSGCNTAGGPFGLAALVALAALRFRKKSSS